MKTTKRIMLLAGGTGGHVMPALAIAEQLRAHDFRIIWVGAPNSLEAKVAKRARLTFRRIYIRGMRRNGWLRLLETALVVPWGVLHMLCLMLWYRPRCVLGMGGYVSGPGGVAAKLLRLPLVIHEQNTVAGLTNKYLARYANQVFCGFPSCDGIKRFTWVGNPLQQRLLNVLPPEQRLAERDGTLRVLVLGGSLGAQVFNSHLPQLLGRVAAKSAHGIEVLHQCGNAPAGEIAAAYRAAGIRGEVRAFIDNMAAVYAWCDVVICRAGAMSIAEICAVGNAAIMVPYPYAVNDHQTHNARYLSKNNAAYLVHEQNFISGKWLKWLAHAQQDRSKLLKLAVAARKLACRDAAIQVAQACLEVRHA